MSNQLPPENDTDFMTYVKWVIKKWLIILSTGEFVVLGMLWAALGFNSASLINYLLFFILALFAQVLAASYFLWRDEREDKLSFIGTVKKKELAIQQLSSEKGDYHRENQQLKTTIHQMEQDRKPQLFGRVNLIEREEIQDNTGKNVLGIRILLLIDISNKSIAPTVISDFKLKISLPTGANFISHVGTDSTKFGLRQEECFLSYQTLLKNNQWLLQYAPIGEKISYGAKYEGWIFFDCEVLKSFDGLDLSRDITLTAVDAFNDEHLIDNGLLKKFDQEQ